MKNSLQIGKGKYSLVSENKHVPIARRFQRSSQARKNAIYYFVYCLHGYRWLWPRR